MLAGQRLAAHTCFPGQVIELYVLKTGRQSNNWSCIPHQSAKKSGSDCSGWQVSISGHLWLKPHSLSGEWRRSEGADSHSSTVRWSSWNVKANLYLYQVMFHINLSSIIVWALLYLPFMWHLTLALPSSVHTVSGGASCQIKRNRTLNLRANHWRFPKGKVSTRFAPEGSKHTPQFSPIMGL